MCIRDSRCAVRDIVASSHVPERLRTCLRLAYHLRNDWNELTSSCDRSSTCSVSSDRVLSEYFAEDASLMRLASESTLREPAVLALVAPRDREAYQRNSRRFESAMQYAASSAKLSQFDPPLPRFAKGQYVPTGLKDENGNLLGTNLENARDFLLDASDALLVACSFVYYTR